MRAAVVELLSAHAKAAQLHSDSGDRNITLLFRIVFKAFPLLQPRHVAPLKKALDLRINLRPSRSL